MPADHDHGQTVHATNRKRLTIALSITATILVAEVIGAIATNSLALLVDAAHMLTDAAGLATALIAAHLATRPTSARRTWGFARAEVLAATGQAAVLLGVGLFVLIEGIQRLFEPPEIASTGLLVFGIIGLVGNIASITVLAAGRKSNFNLRAAFLEVVNDALGSLAVRAAAITIAVTGWAGADAVAGLLIGVLIMPRAFKLLRETLNVLLESTPAGLDLDDVRAHILALDRVVAVHDLHASQISSGLPVLTAHVTIESRCFTDGTAPAILDALQKCVADHFAVSIEHSTFQLEPVDHQEHEHVPHA